ncbi:MAG: ribonuclease III [Sphingomonadales bacterium]
MARQDHIARWAVQALDHGFNDSALLAQALTHPSVDGTGSYQRLEFLGDRVLGVVIAHWLYQHFPAEPEGKLATRFTSLVRRETLADVGREIDLARQINLAAGAREEGAQHKDSVLADVCEALVGALYLDGGLAVAEAFIRRHWAQRIDADTGPRKDAKTRLQEWVQGRGLPAPTYEEVARSGPAHAPHFIVEAVVEGMAPSRGEGSTKREAQQQAAEAMLVALKTERT